MYRVDREKKEYLKKIENIDKNATVFTTYEWVSFIEENQNAESVVLRLSENGKTVAIFVGLIVRRMGIKILGSPFEGWLTCDMGFIHLDQFDINNALKTVANYAFTKLKCWYFQITDKQIDLNSLDSDIRFYTTKIVRLDNSRSTDDILAGFTKNGRRDVRASQRKNITIEVSKPDYSFMDMYYDQLVDVFDKQGLKPFYSKQKMYDLVNAFKDDGEKLISFKAYDENGTCIATVLSVGFHNWAYYMGAASYRSYQKLLPNERLFWQFVNYWNERGVNNIDMVGVREYKMKYSPELRDCPVIYFERIPGIQRGKVIIKFIVSKIRTIRGVFAEKRGK